MEVPDEQLSEFPTRFAEQVLRLSQLVRHNGSRLVAGVNEDCPRGKEADLVDCGPLLSCRDRQPESSELCPQIWYTCTGLAAGFFRRCKLAAWACLSCGRSTTCGHSVQTNTMQMRP